MDLNALIKKGSKTSEFYVVLLFAVPWVCQNLGIDVGPIASVLTGIAQDPNSLEELAKIRQPPSNLAELVGLAFVVGRVWLKYQALNKSKTPKEEKDD